LNLFSQQFPNRRKNFQDFDPASIQTAVRLKQNCRTVKANVRGHSAPTPQTTPDQTQQSISPAIAGTNPDGFIPGYRRA
jgi:hypothetical protein